MVKNSPMKKSPRSVGLTSKFDQIFRGELTQICSEFSTSNEEGTLPNLFYEANITLIPKLDKDSVVRTENYRSIFLIDTNIKVLNKILEVRLNNTVKDSAS